MEVAMMGGDEKKHTFHDFLGMNCGDPDQPSAAWAQVGGKMAAAEAAPEGEAEASASMGLSSGWHGLVSGSSDLGSEWQGGSSSEVFHFHGRKNAASGPEIGSTLSVTKRSNSDSAYMGLVRDRMLPVGSDSLESLCRRKMFRKEAVSEQLGRSHDDELMIAMRPPRPTSHVLHPPVSSRPGSLIHKWEQSMPVNPGQMVHYPARFAQGGIYVDKVSSSCAFKDASAGATTISQTVADEGSRTGIKGSGTVIIINPISGADERNSTAVLPCGNRPKASQAIVPDSCNIPRHTTVSASWQMTIFYAGQAHVFDDVHPNKADLIMALAGSNGGSWSTSYFPANEAKARMEENETRTNNVVSSMHGGLDHGHSQVAWIPVTGDLSSLMPGSMSVRDAETRTGLQRWNLTCKAGEMHARAINIYLAKCLLVLVIN